MLIRQLAMYSPHLILSLSSLSVQTSPPGVISLTTSVEAHCIRELSYKILQTKHTQIKERKTERQQYNRATGQPTTRQQPVR